ncbi:MAG TPA: hypothetical protein VFH61_12920 [Thermoleophilia bacterium]|nr:hypothetical protein [Thermoleophilia bacterium]
MLSTGEMQQHAIGLRRNLKGRVAVNVIVDSFLVREGGFAGEGWPL